MRRFFKFFFKTTIYFYLVPVLLFLLLASIVDKEENLVIFNAIVITFVFIGVIVYWGGFDDDKIGFAIYISLLLVICLSVSLFSLNDSISKIKKYRKAKMADNISVNEVGSFTKADFIRFIQGNLFNKFSTEIQTFDIEYDTEEEKIYETKEFFSATPYVNSTNEIKGEISVWVVCDKSNCGRSQTFSGVGKVEDFYSNLLPNDPYFLAIKKAMTDFGLNTAAGAVLVTDMPKNFNVKSEIRKAWKNMTKFNLWAFFFWIVLGNFPAYIEAFKFVFRKVRR